MNHAPEPLKPFDWAMLALGLFIVGIAFPSACAKETHYRSMAAELAPFQKR